MGRYVLLDSGPLGLAVCRRGAKSVDELRGRLAELEMAGVSVMIPAVVDYEVRRELVRVRNEPSEVVEQCLRFILDIPSRA